MRTPTRGRFAPLAQAPPLAFLLSFSFEFTFNLNFKKRVAVKWLEKKLDLNSDLTLDLTLNLTLNFWSDLRNIETLTGFFVILNRLSGVYGHFYFVPGQKRESGKLFPKFSQK